MKKTSIGGQGVLEGVMMRSETYTALSVRLEDGSIKTKRTKNKVHRHKWMGWPIIRGCVNLVDMLRLGVGVINDSATMYDSTTAEEPSKFDKFVAKKTGKDSSEVMMGLAVVLAVLLSVVLFMFLPMLARNLVERFWNPGDVVLCLIEGLIRITIFLLYMVLVTLQKDVRRVFMYHGAEHKTISCYESELPLTVENARTQKRLHPRCGTSFMLIVMIIAILVHALLSPLNVKLFTGELVFWQKLVQKLFDIAFRLVLIPPIAGISYEVLKLAARYDNWFTKALRWPGMQLQYLTTREPDDDMLEIAILSFEMALNEKSREEIIALRKSFEHKAESPDGECPADTDAVTEEAHAPEGTAPGIPQEETVAPEEGPDGETQQA